MALEAEPVTVPISKRLVLINSASMIGTRVLTAGVFLWVIQHLLKRIPEAEMELLPIVMSLALILPVLQTILTGGLGRFVTEAYARNDMAGVTAIVSSQFPLLLAGGVLVMLVGGAVAWNIQHFLNIAPEFLGKARFMLLLIVGRMAVGMPILPFNTGLFANQRFVLQNAIDVVGSLMRAGLMLGLILGLGPNVEWVVVANIASQLFGQITSAVISVRLLPALRFRPSNFDWNTCKRILSFNGWNFVAQSASTVRRAADAPILNLLASPLAVNDFYLGSVIETQLRELLIRATQPLLPALTAMHAHAQKQRLASAYLRGGRLALWAAMAMAVPLMIFSYDLYSLYLGKEYSEHVNAATVLILLLLGLPLAYPSLMLVAIGHATANIRPIALCMFWAQVLNLLLTLFFVGWLDMAAIGSALATMVSLVALNPFALWPLALRMLDISWRQFMRETLIPGLSPAIVAAAAGSLGATLGGGSETTRIVIGIPACLAAYAVCVLITLRPADRADLARVQSVLRM
jgi:O-antigen/teichoic acid export membrane protein